MTLTDMYEQLTGPLSIGKLLHAYRSTHEWSLQKLADKLSIDARELSRIENELLNVEIHQVIQFARTLNEDVDFYVEVFLRDLLRKSGLNPSTYIKSLE